MSYPVSDAFTSTAAFVADRSTGTVSGGRARATATSTNTSIGNTANVDVMDQYAEVVVATLGTTTSEVGAYTRFTPTTYYLGLMTNLTGGTATLVIYKYNGASFVNLVQQTGTAVTLPATIRLTSQGTRHTLSLNGTPQISVEDVDYTHGTPGTHLLATTSTANAEAESFAADVPTALTTPYRVQRIGTAVSTSTNGPPNTLSISFTGTDKPQTGDQIVAYLARDNITNDPATGDSISATPGSETYTRVALAQPSGTSTANAGIVGAAFYATVGSTWAGGTNTFTATMPDAAADRVLAVDHWRNLGALRGTADTNGSTNNASVTTTDPVSGDAVLGMVCWEHSSASTVTSDTDTSSGSWEAAPAQLASGGTTGAAVKLTTQHKIVTATANQTFNPTNSSTADSVGIVLTFEPASSAASATLDDAAVTVTASNLTATSGATLAAGTTAATTANAPSGTRTTVAATATVTANNVGYTDSTTPTAAAATTTASNLTASSGATLAAAAVTVTANNLGYTDSPIPAAATATVTASNLTASNGATLTAAAVTVAAGDLSSTAPTSVTLGTATVSVTAVNGLTGATPAAAAVSTTANKLADALTTTAATVTVTATTPGSGDTFTAATTVTTTATQPSAGHTPAAAAVTVTANNLTQTRNATPIAAAVAVTGADLEGVLLGAEQLGTGRTAPAATVTVVENAGGYTGKPVPTAGAVTTAANGLTKISNNIGTAAGTVTATTPVVALTFGTATVSVAANPLTPPGTLTLGTAIVVATPATPATFNLVPNQRTAGTAAVTATATSPSYTAATAVTATATFTANDPDFGEFIPTTAPVTISVGQLTVGQQFAVASLAVLANNTTGTNRTLGAAAVTAQSYDLFLTPTASLGYGAATVGAYNLNALNHLGTATVSTTANPSESTRTTTTATAAATAAKLISGQLNLGTATVTATAYDLARQSPGQYAMGYGTVGVAGFNLLPLIQVGTGLASVAFVAQSFAYQADTASGTGAVTGEAANLIGTDRTAAGVTINITAYGLGQTAPPIGLAVVAVAAYGLSNGETLPVSFRSAVVAEVRQTEIEADVQISPDVLVTVR